MTADPPRTNGEQPLAGNDPQFDGCEVLDVLGDPTCRSILAETVEDRLTVEEIATRCAIPLSTAYRKVDDIVSTGLLTRHDQFRENGSTVSTYECHVDDLLVSLNGQTGPTVSVRSA